MKRLEWRSWFALYRCCYPLSLNLSSPASGVALCCFVVSDYSRPALIEPSLICLRCRTILFCSVSLLSAFPSCMWTCLICRRALSAFPMSGSSASRNATQRSQRDYDCGVHYVQSLGVSTTQWDSIAAFSIFNGFQPTCYPSHPFYPPNVQYDGMIVALEQWTFSNGIHSASRLISPDHYHLIS